MNLEDIILSEISQSQDGKSCMIPFYELPRAVKFIETESNGVGAGEKGACLVGAVQSFSFAG